MKLVQISLPALLLALATGAQAELGSRPPTAAKLGHRDRLYDVSASGGKLFVVGHPGLLLRSDDGGATFSAVSGGQKDEALFSIAFNAKGQGAIVGRSGFVLTSEDMGKSWRKTEVILGEEKPSLFGVSVLPGGVIVAVGEFGAIVRSEDRGKSWTRSSYDAALAAVPAEQLPEGCAVPDADDENSDMIQEARLTDVHFANDEYGLISGEFGLMLASDDGGRTFTRQNSCTDKTLFGLAMVDDKRSLAVGADGTAVETKDGGQTWQLLETGTIEHLFGAYADAQRAVLVGAAGTLLTRSANKPLGLVPTNMHGWLSSAQLDDKGQGIVVGGRAHVLKTSDGGNTQTRVLGE